MCVICYECIICVAINQAIAVKNNEYYNEQDDEWFFYVDYIKEKLECLLSLPISDDDRLYKPIEDNNHLIITSKEYDYEDCIEKSGDAMCMGCRAFLCKTHYFNLRDKKTPMFTPTTFQNCQLCEGGR